MRVRLTASIALDKANVVAGGRNPSGRSGAALLPAPLPVPQPSPTLHSSASSSGSRLSRGQQQRRGGGGGRDSRAAGRGIGGFTHAFGRSQSPPKRSDQPESTMPNDSGGYIEEAEEVDEAWGEMTVPPFAGNRLMSEGMETSRGEELATWRAGSGRGEEASVLDDLENNRPSSLEDLSHLLSDLGVRGHGIDGEQGRPLSLVEQRSHEQWKESVHLPLEGASMIRQRRQRQRGSEAPGFVAGQHSSQKVWPAASGPWGGRGHSESLSEAMSPQPPSPTGSSSVSVERRLNSLVTSALQSPQRTSRTYSR